MILSLFITAVVSAVAIGATIAYFTDTAVLGENIISTGTVSIVDTRDSWMLTVDLTNLKPGDTVRKWVVFQNDGSLDIGSLVVTAINKTGDIELLENVNVSVYGTVDGYDQGIYTPDWGNGQPITPWLNGIDLLGTAVYRDSTAGHILIPGAEDTIIIDFKVPTTVGNDMQGKSATFDLEFIAQQTI